MRCDIAKELGPFQSDSRHARKLMLVSSSAKRRKLLLLMGFALFVCLACGVHLVRVYGECVILER